MAAVKCPGSDAALSSGTSVKRVGAHGRGRAWSYPAPARLITTIEHGAPSVRNSIARSRFAAGAAIATTGAHRNSTSSTHTTARVVGLNVMLFL